jgi:hypothetical protein
MPLEEVCGKPSDPEVFVGNISNKAAFTSLCLISAINYLSLVQSLYEE